MKRKTNISVWQLRLFEGFDKDIMVMQRDEEEVFDDAIHVFFEKEYYDAYVAKATKYSGHQYAYHEDKLGEVINQIFDEDIPGLVLHINANENAPKNTLGEEKYIASKELLGLRDAADSYHFLYTAAIDRCSKEDAVARLWTKSVYIIGQLPDFRVKPKEGEKPVFELITMKRKKDGGKVTADDYDYESLKVFLTMDSAMHFNPEKKPVNKYKLAVLSQLLKGKLHVIIEPHRNYYLEYDPATLDLAGHLDIPRYNEEMVRARIQEYTQMDKIYILLAPMHSDYRLSSGNPFLIKADNKNILMYLFEKYDDAVNYVLQNPMTMPIFDSTFPIGVLDQKDKLLCLETVLALAAKLGVTGVNLDFDTVHAIGCKMEYIRNVTGYDRDVEAFLSEEELSQVMREEDGGKKYRMPIVPFSDPDNEYYVSEERKAELIAHMDNDYDQGFAYLAGCTVIEMMVMMQEAAVRFDTARKASDEENTEKYVRLMNRITFFLTEALCEKPYIYTLREENGDFALKNNIAYLIITNRYETGRKGEGRLMPAGIDNPQFMEKLCEASKVAVLTDGPSIVCMVDTKLMSEVAKQWKNAEPLREELMIYLTQGCGLSYPEAGYYYRRLRTDNSIFVEFVSAVRDGAYPSVGMLTIEGFTAQGLAEANGFNMLQAYDALLSLKENPANAEKFKRDAISGNGMENDAERNLENSSEDNSEKKGLFGKLFKK
ncbi:MAG: hypothetical protein K2K74_06700 [Lachnospiraceae bacterium]|nr:hypothetical protein [Lachnospiraceae bacterium]